jgi:hypothetical protein
MKGRSETIAITDKDRIMEILGSCLRNQGRASIRPLFLEEKKNDRWCFERNKDGGEQGFHDTGGS